MDSQPQKFIRTPLNWGCYVILGLYTAGLAVYNAAMPLPRQALGLNDTVMALFMRAVAEGVLTAGSQGARLLVANRHAGAETGLVHL